MNHVSTRSRLIFEFSAGGLVLDEQGRVLLIRARDLRNLPVWTLPKGALMPGETNTEAALREVREETGLDCRFGEELEPVCYTDRKGRPKVVRYWLMEPVEGGFEPGDEVDELRWVRGEEAVVLLTYPHDRELVAEALSRAEKTGM